MFADAHISSLGYLCQNILVSQRLTDITIFEKFLICNSRLLVQTPPQPNTKFPPHFSLTQSLLTISLRNQFPFSRYHIHCKAAGRWKGILNKWDLLIGVGLV